MWAWWASGRRLLDLRRSGWRWAGGALVLAVLCAAAYGQAAALGFTYDDEDYLNNARRAHADPRLLVRPAIPGPWASRVGVHLYMYLLWPLFGARPAPYHLASVALHWANAILLWLLAARSLGRPSVGFAAAVWFVVSPAPYRAVLWISAVSLVLGMTLLLAAVLAGQAYGARGGWWRLGAAGALFAGSPLLHQAYAAAAVVPAALVGARAPRAGASRRAALLAACVAPAAAVVLLERWLYQGAYTGQDTYRLWGVHVPVNLAGYLGGLLASPWGQALGATGRPPVTMALGAAGAVAVALASRSRPLRPWTLWVLAGILPFAFWRRPQLFARYFYAASPGGCVLLAAAVGAAAESLERRTRAPVARVALACGVCLVAAIGICQVRRLHAVQLYDEGKYLLFARREPQRAIGRLEAALRRDPNVPDKVRLWLAWAWHESGEDAAARAVLEELLRRTPGHEQAQALLGSLAAAPAADQGDGSRWEP